MLEKIAESIITNKTIIEKQAIRSIIQDIKSNTFKSARVLSDIGEDAASIKNQNEILTLITTDRIKTSFIENFPYGAGFSSILVGIDDIYACGGIPLAASIILSFKDKNIGNQIIGGICEGSKKFKVPIVRGHTSINNSYELSSTIIGEIESNNYISSKNAQNNDDVLLAVDFDGKIGKANRMYWDTTTFKTSDMVLNKRKSMNIIAKSQLAHSSKDISNSGIFGTAIQLAQFSKKGVNIDITNLVIPPFLVKEQYGIIDYAQMFLTTSFILTAPKENSEKIIKIFKNHSMIACKIGEVLEEKCLLLSEKQKQIKVMDL